MSVKTWWLVLLCGFGLAWPALAQEEEAPKEPPAAEEKTTIAEPAPPKSGLEDPALHKWGGWTLSLAGWSPTLVGAEEEVATFESVGVNQPLYQESDASIKETVRILYHIPHDAGTIVLHYDAMDHEDELQNLLPGQFVFSETRGFPVLLGAFDDGLADGVVSTATRRTREFRLEYQKKAFDSRWAKGTWSAGYRQLSHSRLLGITYYAIVPNLPPIIPPVDLPPGFDPDSLIPVPDGVSQTSNFSGHGLGASLDVEFPVHPRVSIVSGLSIGLIRGTSESKFSATSSFYSLIPTPDVPLTKDELFELLSNPQPPAGDGEPYVPQIGDLLQTTLQANLNSTTASQMAQSYDAYIGVQVIAYKGLRVFATIRDVSYINVGEYIVPKPGPTNEKTALNAGYEGYTVGISYRF